MFFSLCARSASEGVGGRMKLPDQGRAYTGTRLLPGLLRAWMVKLNLKAVVIYFSEIPQNYKSPTRTAQSQTRPIARRVAN